MPRIKSRPTHRENAAAAPSNEGGFYKMFWNSMDTNQGTNGPNSPSQMDVPVASPAVIILSDSPADSPCGLDENSCENVVVPLPIKEETREDTVGKPIEAVSTCEDLHDSSVVKISEESAQPLPTCRPGDPLTSRSNNSTPSPPLPNDLNSELNPPPNASSAKCDAVAESEDNLTQNPVNIDVAPVENLGNSDSSEIQDTLEAAEDGEPKLVEETKVCTPDSREDHPMVPETTDDRVIDSGEGEMPSNNNLNSSEVNLEEAPVSEGAPQPPSPHRTPIGSPAVSEIGVASGSHSNDGMIDTIKHLETNAIPSCTDQETPETPMDGVSAPHSPVPALDNPEEAPIDDMYDPRFASVDGNAEENEKDTEDAIQAPHSPSTYQIYNLLKCMLNTDEDVLENVNRDLDLYGLNDNDSCIEPSESNAHDEGEGVQVTSDHENSLHSNTEVSTMEIDQMVMAEINHDDIVSEQAQPNDMVIEDENDPFPLKISLPKKIKIDAIGVIRSVRVLKEELRAVFKSCLKEDVLLRTRSESPTYYELPTIVEHPEAPDVVETPEFPPTIVYPICCVKMERLPEPFIKKSTVAMSDETFKTWKKQITLQRNEEKFRHLKVWRRGRTLLWRECELAGMDRSTYDEQVAYVNKHKVNENSSSDEDSDNESGDDNTAGHYESSEDSSEDEYVDREGSPINPPLSKSVDHSRISTSIELSSPSVPSVLGDEYTIESSSSNQSSPTKAPSALKITIRKTSTSKSDEDKMKTVKDTEEITTFNDDNFMVPIQPSVGKTRKVATKRTFRRPDDRIAKPQRPKNTLPKSKNTVEPEDLYDQSLLGTRRDEVENFNLLEKWDIPFEAPTLFRSPRVASRLAQLKTKEAFATAHKKQTPKTGVSTSVNVVSKEVKDVVEMLCSKTVEAMLFPEATPNENQKSSKPVGSGTVVSKDPIVNVQIEAPLKSSVNEESSSNLDESSELSQSETNSTLDASSDFGGSTTSLVSDDLPPPKNKSPQKPRRRRRFGAWNNKKKKVKGKISDGPIVPKDSSEGDGNMVKEDSDKPPVTEKTDNVDHQPKLEESASPAHSTQVPVVSEGPGQKSPYESEDDSTHKTKDRMGPNPPDPVGGTEHERNKETIQMNRLEWSENKVGQVEIPKEEPQTNKKAQQPSISPRLTRSKQPSIQLDPDLLENFGSRKRKPAGGVSDGSAHDSSAGGKKTKPEVAKTPAPRNKARKSTHAPSFAIIKATEDDDNSNTQVPEVSEGPGELNSDSKQDNENSKDSLASQGRMLRSRSRVSCPTPSVVKDSPDDSQKTKPIQAEEDKLNETNVSEDTLVLESPQSPPPEIVEPEPLVNDRITRSQKRRSGSAFVSFKTTEASNLPSVCAIVDSIAGQRLPILSQLFNASTKASSQAAEDAMSATSDLDKTPCSDDKVTSSPSKPSQKCDENHENTDMKLDEPPTPLTSEPEQNNAPMDSAVSGNELGVQEVESATDSLNSEGANSTKDDSEEVVTNVENGRLKVLDTLNTILAVASPKKDSATASPDGSLTEPPLSADLQTLSAPNVTQSSMTSTYTPPCGSTMSAFPNGITQDITSILPGTILPSLPDLRTTLTTLDTDFGSISNDLEDATIISPWADSPGDLVVDDDEELNTNTTLDVLNDFIKDSTLEAFSDDETNNTDLADKIDKIILDQMHQDASPIPSLKQKNEVGPKTNNKPDGEDGTPTSESDKSAPSLNRRDSIDERTGLPNTLIQRLRDPRIRSRLLSHLEEVETQPQPTCPSIPVSQRNPSDVSSKSVDQIAATPQEPCVAEISGNSWTNVDGTIVPAVGYPNASVAISSSLGAHHTAVSTALTLPASGTQIEVTQTSASQGLVTPSIPQATPVLSAQLVITEATDQLPPVLPGTPHIENPEVPPDPSQVDFLVPPSDDEEEESIKRRPKKAKKEVDVELMYKSPLEDLQSEARPAYGERAQRRYADNFPRRRSGDPRSSWDDRRPSRRDERRSYDSRDSRPSRDRSRDRRYGSQRDRDRSRDRRSYYDRPPRDHISYDDRYPREDEKEGLYHMEQPFNQTPWHGDSSSIHHPGMMMNTPEHPHWQQNYYVEVPPPPIFVPELPKIDYMETRLINLELLPKTTNLDLPAIRKMYSCFDRDNIQMLRIPPPTYDPNDQARTIKMMDPTGEEMIDFAQLPRPTSGLTKETFRHVPPNLSLEDVVTFHFISPAYVMVQDNEEDPISDSEDEDDQLEETYADKLRLLHVKNFKSLQENNMKLGMLDESHLRPESRTVRDYELEDNQVLQHVNREFDEEVRQMQESNPAPKMELGDDPLENILQRLPLLKEQYAMLKSQLPIPPPPPQWNDVDLRVSDGDERFPLRKPSPVVERPSRRSRSPYKSRRARSRSPRRKRRSRSRSLSSDMSISLSPSSISSSPSRRRRSPKRRRSRSRSSERSRTKRSYSPKQRSTSISPSRRRSRR